MFARLAEARWFPFVLLAVLTLAVYAPVLRHEFVTLDDSLLIYRNTTIQELTPRSIARAFTTYDPELYVPLTLFTYQIEHAIVGLQPWLFHLTNILLHAGSGLLLFLLASRLLGGKRWGFLCALLFVLHPINTEAVAWAAARKDVLSAFFFLLSLLLYEIWREKGGRALYVLGVAAFALALLSKVTVLMLPAVLFLLEWRRGGLDLRRLRAIIPHMLLSVVFGIIAVFGKTRGLGSIGIVNTVLLACKGVAFYLLKIIAPARLSVLYPQETPITHASAEFFVPVMIVALLLVAIVLLRRRRDVVVGLSLFLLAVGANSFNFWKNGSVFFASDRYVYIASIGIFIALVSILRDGLSRASSTTRTRVIVIVMCIAIVILGTLAVLQSRVWHTSETLYRASVAYYPQSPLALNNLGDVLVRQGKRDDGLRLFEAAAAADPSNILARTNAGNIYKERGDLDRAAALYQEAIAVVPSSPFVEHLAPYYLLGELRLEQGRMEEGFALLRQATERLPAAGEPFYNLGVLSQKYGRADQAINAYESAVAVEPMHIAARYHLASLYAERGRLDDAMTHLRAVIAIDPNYEKAREHLGNMERMMQR